jgi:hypothetical protein
MVVSSSEKDNRASLVEIVSEEMASVLTPEEVLELGIDAYFDVDYAIVRNKHL